MAIASRAMRITTDYLVLGSGIAGLTFALRAAEHGEVAIVTKRGRADSATNWAQGGISAVLDPADTFDAHVQDTLVAGAPPIVTLDVPVRFVPVIVIAVPPASAPAFGVTDAIVGGDAA
jgi:hypothetical protein